MRRAATVIVCLGLAGCVAPARSYGAYEGKAVATAQTALSAVSTAMLAARVGARGDAFAPYVATTLADAEGDVRSAQGLFDSIQPPDPSSDRLRSRLDAILADANEEITALRVRARWTDVAALGTAADRLRDLGNRLRSFLDAHE
ncbi:MAG: hypothetical protein ACXVP3_04550 [Actinomycetota bacterium]